MAARPLGGVVPQWCQGAGVQRHQAGLAAFAGSAGDHAAVEVNISAGQCQRFADPQAGAGDQPEQGGVTVRPQAAGRGQRGSGAQQIGDLAV